MLLPNMNYANLKDSYLFTRIAQKTAAYLQKNPGKHLYRMGIGDVSLPLCDVVIRSLQEAVNDQGNKERFHGYMPECGAPFLRSAIAAHYRGRGIALSEDEVFVSSGASDELGDILHDFRAKIMEAADSRRHAGMEVPKDVLDFVERGRTSSAPTAQSQVVADLAWKAEQNRLAAFNASLKK